MRSNLDGTNAVVIRNADLDNPNSVAVVDGQVYVLDSHHKKREQPDFDEASSPGRLYRVTREGQNWTEVASLQNLKVGTLPNYKLQFSGTVQVSVF